MIDIEKGIFNLIIATVIVIVLTIILAITFVTINHEKVYDSCKTTGTYYIGGDKAIKCEIIEKGK